MVDSAPWQDWHSNPGCSASVSAALLLLPFSIIGPVPFWRTFFAWLAFVPLFYGLLSRDNLQPPAGLLRGTAGRVSHGLSLVFRQLLLDLPDHALLRRPAAAHLRRHPDRLQHGAGPLLRHLGLAANRYSKGISQPRCALLAAPFFWVALELLSARFTKVPWDLLGYSQVDNFLLTRSGPLHRGVRDHLRADGRQRAHRVGSSGLDGQRRVPS